MDDDTPQKAGSATRQEFEADLIARAGADAAFKQRLLTDARAAIREAYGAEIPPDIEIQVLEEQSDKYYFVIPMPDLPESGELTDDQLTAVSGGGGDRSRPSGYLPAGSLYFSRMSQKTGGGFR